MNDKELKSFFKLSKTQTPTQFASKANMQTHTRQVSRFLRETPAFWREMLSPSRMQKISEISRILAFVTIFLV